MNKKIMAIGTAFAALLLASCQPVENQKQVVATMFAHYDLTKQLVKGTDIAVDFPVASGIDLHDWEPNVSAIAKVLNADLLITVGLEFDLWVENVLEANTFAGKHLDTSLHVDLLEGHDHEEDHDEDHEEEHEEEHEDHGEYDPHYWLDPANALKMAEVIHENLMELFNEDSMVIHENFENLEAQLNLLIDGFVELTGDNHHDEVVEEEEHDHTTLIYAGHNAFGYFSNYGIEFVTPYSGFSTSTLPTATSIASLLNTIESLGTSYIYASQLEGTAVANSLIENIPTLEILYLSEITNVLESQRDTFTYVGLMEDNLNALELSIDHD
jgi:zinc transport system substrate-binding protein